MHIWVSHVGIGSEKLATGILQDCDATDFQYKSTDPKKMVELVD